MIRRPAALGCALALAACRDPAAGTFVGNPDMTARLQDNDVHLAQAGSFEATELRLDTCNDQVDIGVTTFTFDGAEAREAVRLPTGDLCGLSFTVGRFEVQFDDGGDQVTVIANDFHLSVPADYRVTKEGRYVLRFGNEAWLSNVAAVAQAGDNVIDGLNPDLDEAFFGGLDSSALLETNAEPESPVGAGDGRLNLADYPESPLGTPTTWASCGPDMNLDLAVPIPPAAMGAGDGRVGWCEGPIHFTNTLEPITAVQQDYSDQSTYEVTYNGWGQGCDALHCDQAYDADGVPLDRTCTVLAFCDGDGNAAVTGFFW